MTKNQKKWSTSRDELAAALEPLGYPADLAELLARQLGSPRAIDRMTSWLYQARPRSMEMIVDEMLAICADVQAWRQKKEAEKAQAGYSAWLNSGERYRRMDEE